jgi:hypothetical protein
VAAVTFTPQAVDPQKLLRKNLKTKVENQVTNVMQTFFFVTFPLTK